MAVIENALFLPNGILEKYEHVLWWKRFNEIFDL